MIAAALLLAILAAPPSELPRAEWTPGAVRASGLDSPSFSAVCPRSFALGDRLRVVAVQPAGQQKIACPGPVTAAEVCSSRGTRQYRHTEGVTKRMVCAAYGISAADCPQYEDDHLVPLELGGSDVQANHWPQPWTSEWNAMRKDWLEGELRRLVCDRRVLPLDRAQRCIAEEWTLCYAQAIRGEHAAMGRP